MVPLIKIAQTHFFLVLHTFVLIPKLKEEHKLFLQALYFICQVKDSKFLKSKLQEIGAFAPSSAVKGAKFIKIGWKICKITCMEQFLIYCVLY